MQLSGETVLRRNVVVTNFFHTINIRAVPNEPVPFRAFRILVGGTIPFCSVLFRILVTTDPCVFGTAFGTANICKLEDDSKVMLNNSYYWFESKTVYFFFSSEAKWKEAVDGNQINSGQGQEMVQYGCIY